MRKQIQAKHVDKLPILKFLNGLDRWACIFKEGSGDDRTEVFPNSVWNAIPHTVPYKVGAAAMYNLVKRGLVSGCTCGCRGDFEITEKGKEFLANVELYELSVRKFAVCINAFDNMIPEGEVVKCEVDNHKIWVTSETSEVCFDTKSQFDRYFVEIPLEE